jgi:hypothetical protein
MPRLAPQSGTGTFGPYRPAEAIHVASGIQQLIDEADAGNPRASEQLFAALYDELHRLAEGQLHRRIGNLSLGTTTLLHEAYLRLADGEGVRFASRGHFLGERRTRCAGS